MRDNFMSGAAAAALNDNAPELCRYQLSGAVRGAQDVQRADELMGTTKRVDELRYSAGMRPQYWKSRAQQQSDFYLGDLNSMRAPSFVMPTPYKRPESNVEELADKYYDD